MPEIVTVLAAEVFSNLSSLLSPDWGCQDPPHLDTQVKVLGLSDSCLPLMFLFQLLFIIVYALVITCGIIGNLLVLVTVCW